MSWKFQNKTCQTAVCPLPVWRPTVLAARPAACRYLPGLDRPLKPESMRRGLGERLRSRRGDRLGLTARAGLADRRGLRLRRYGLCNTQRTQHRADTTQDVHTSHKRRCRTCDVRVVMATHQPRPAPRTGLALHDDTQPLDETRPDVVVDQRGRVLRVVAAPVPAPHPVHLASGARSAKRHSYCTLRHCLPNRTNGCDERCMQWAKMKREGNVYQETNTFGSQYRPMLILSISRNCIVVKLNIYI